MPTEVSLACAWISASPFRPLLSTWDLLNLITATSTPHSSQAGRNVCVAGTPVSWLGWWWAEHLQTLQPLSQTSPCGAWVTVDTAVLLKKSSGGCLICSPRVLLSKRGYWRAVSDASHSSSTAPWHNLKTKTSSCMWGTKSHRGTTPMKCWVFPRVKDAQPHSYGEQSHLLTFLNSF